MISETGVISIGGKTMGQINIIEKEDEKRVQLYNAEGVYLCDCAFSGDDDIGFMVGQGLFNGYIVGQNNTKVAISANITRAIYEKGDLMI